MSLPVNLPPPDENALAHSCALQSMIREKITVAGGWIPFERYMDLVLYAPGMGYYSSGATKLGSAGDFVTAPELSALFGRTLARQLWQVMESIESCDVLEFGAGSGRLAVDMLLELEQAGRLPGKYFIVEVSAELRQRQQMLFSRKIAHLLSRIEWLDRLPDRFTGIVLANEVLDAMPVHLVVWRDGEILERGVAWCDDRFVWRDRPVQGEELHTAADRLSPLVNPDGAAPFHYVSEINLAAAGFMRSLNALLQRGAVLLIDYGFGEREYYHPQRNQGTLMCHYRHHAHDDPFFLPGLQDITSHVNFSAIAQAALENELELLGYTTQAHFLINCGIVDQLARTSAADPSGYLPLSNQLQKLVSPAEMGELFKVIAFGKAYDHPLDGFYTGDMSRLL